MSRSDFQKSTISAERAFHKLAALYRIWLTIIILLYHRCVQWCFFQICTSPSYEPWLWRNVPATLRYYWSEWYRWIKKEVYIPVSENDSKHSTTCKGPWSVHINYKVMLPKLLCLSYHSKKIRPICNSVCWCPEIGGVQGNQRSWCANFQNGWVFKFEALCTENLNHFGHHGKWKLG